MVCTLTARRGFAPPPPPATPKRDLTLGTFRVIDSDLNWYLVYLMSTGRLIMSKRLDKQAR